MRKLTEAEKRKLREKIEEARDDTADRVIQRAKKLENNLVRRQQVILRRVL